MVGIGNVKNILDPFAESGDPRGQHPQPKAQENLRNVCQQAGPVEGNHLDDGGVVLNVVAQGDTGTQRKLLELARSAAVDIKLDAVWCEYRPGQLGDNLVAELLVVAKRSALVVEQIEDIEGAVVIRGLQAGVLNGDR